MLQALSNSSALQRRQLKMRSVGKNEKSEAMNNVKIPQRGYSEKQGIFFSSPSPNRNGNKQFGQGRKKNNNNNTALSINIRSSKHSEENDRAMRYARILLRFSSRSGPRLNIVLNRLKHGAGSRREPRIPPTALGCQV